MPRYIDAEEFKHNINASNLYGSEAWDKVMNALADTETADVAPVVHAHWGVQRVTKSAKQGRTIILLSCSNCGELNGRRISNYCPRCGAKMDEEVI